MKLRNLTDKQLLKLKSRLENKKSELFNRQLSFKILMNSLYGCLGNEYYRDYDVRLAKTITMTGRYSIQFVGNYINEKFKEYGYNNVWIYGDTDSNYLQLNEVVEDYYNGNVPKDPKVVAKFLDKFHEKKIQPLIDEAILLLMKEFNIEDIHEKYQYFKMNREVIGDSGFWEGKKAYYIRVIDNEGEVYDKPKMKMMGIRNIKRDTPIFVQDHIEEIFNLILDNDHRVVVKWINDFRKKFYNAEFNSIATVKPINKLLEYKIHYYKEDERIQKMIYKEAKKKYPNWKHNVLINTDREEIIQDKDLTREVEFIDNFQVPSSQFIIKTIPAWVRGAMKYNQLLKEKHLEDIYRPIEVGDKVHFIHLQEPNPIHLDCIVWPYNSKYPREFGLYKFIDHKKQFEKTFEALLKDIMNILEWDWRGRRKLGDMIPNLLIQENT